MLSSPSLPVPLPVLSGTDQPESSACHCPQTVKHILIECPALTSSRNKHFTASSTKDLFNNIAARNIINFIKESHFYSTVWCCYHIFYISFKPWSWHHFYLIIIIICYVVFIAFNVNHSSILPLMALNSLYCADVPLSNYSLTPVFSDKLPLQLSVLVYPTYFQDTTPDEAALSIDLSKKNLSTLPTLRFSQAGHPSCHPTTVSNNWSNQHRRNRLGTWLECSQYWLAWSWSSHVISVLTAIFQMNLT